MIYQPTTSLTKIANLAKEKRICCIQGGQGASKTVSILMILINQCLIEANTEVSILGHELTKLKATAVKDFKKIMASWNIFDSNKFTRDSYYTFDNGSYIEFIGLDRTDIGKGLRRDYLYFNEANRGILFETYRQASSRCREKVFLDYNPDSEFWVHREVLTRDDAGLLILTFNDNEYLPEAEKEEILRYKKLADEGSTYWANKWRVYGLGEVGVIEGLVFPDYKIIDELSDTNSIAYGLDFGFTNDPTVLVQLNKVHGTLQGQELIYEKGLTNQDISSRLHSIGFSPNDLIIADSAEPKSIEELRRLGWNIRACRKGADSVNWGIQKINEYGIQITRDSHNWLDEAKNYKYEEKKESLINKPIDRYNHAWDAARYAVEQFKGGVNLQWNETRIRI